MLGQVPGAEMVSYYTDTIDNNPCCSLNINIMQSKFVTALPEQQESNQLQYSFAAQAMK